MVATWFLSEATPSRERSRTVSEIKSSGWCTQELRVPNLLIGHRQRRLGKDPFQLGASLVLAPGNVDRYVHLSTTFGDSADPAALLAIAKE